jgi:hypothetical protein
VEIGGGVRKLRMSQQPELKSPSFAVNRGSTSGSEPSPVPVSGSLFSSEPDDSPATQTPHHTPQRIPRWLERAELFLRVLLRMYIGLAVCYAPWSRVFWDQNPLFAQNPTISAFAAHGAVRGIVSGLGLLNLWIAFQDAVRQGTDKR